MKIIFPFQVIKDNVEIIGMTQIKQMAKQHTHLATWSDIHWRKLMDTGSVAVNPLSTITIWQIKQDSGRVISNIEIYAS